MNALVEFNREVLAKTSEIKSKVEARRDRRGFISYTSYALPALTQLLREVLSEDEVDLQLIERSKFGDDLCLKLPRKLKEHGNTVYIREYVPAIVEKLKQNSELSNLFTAINLKGIYINLQLSPTALFKWLEEVSRYGKRYGESDLWRQHGVVCDYSSPNLAKNLHAGHIRSTVLGHILCNLWEAIGAYSYRVNHLNDLGGVGYLFEGYKRWSELLPTRATKGAQIASLYLLFRSLQKVYDEGAPEALFNEIRERAELCFPGIQDAEGFRKAFAEYAREAIAAQDKLEKGDEEIATLWKQFMGWSLEEFQRFYDALRIHLDFVIGESFYLPGGLQLIEEAKAKGLAVVWDDRHIASLTAELTQLRDDGTIAPQVFDSLVAKAIQDKGATVVPLANYDRVVILRADGVSIYTTRDLQAVRFRSEFFKAKRLAYEVGAEQKEHFRKVFEAARILELCPPETELIHLSHEMYIDAETKKRLSSRVGSEGIERLLVSTIEYFRSKYSKDGEFTPEETAQIAHQLGVGCIIFNDIKKDKKYAVEIHPDVTKMHEEFERSGGAYVVYSACRARSIIRRWGKDLPAPSTLLEGLTLETPEIELIKQIAEYPRKVAEAARTDSPPVLVNYLLDLSRAYNSYYAGYPVLKGDEIHLHRLVITEAVKRVLENGLRLCQTECPERI